MQNEKRTMKYAGPRGKARPVAVLPAALCLLHFAFCVSPSAFAQVANLDDQQFIRGLRERGMKELAIYFVEKNPPKDPIVRVEIQIELAKLLSQDAQAEEKARKQAYAQVRPYYMELLKTAPADHWKRALWATDMVQWDYESLLRGPHINAADFVEFAGFKGATADQRAIFLEVAADDVTIIDEAGLDLRNVIMFAPRERNFQLDWQNTGRWDQLQLTDTLTLPYYKALAINYAALLDKKQQDAIAAKVGTAFKDLLSTADGDLTSIASRANLLPETKAKVLAVHGRIKLRRGQAPAAVKLLDQALAIKEIAPFEKLTAMLCKAHALAAQKQPDAAMKALEDAKKTEVGRHPLNLILVYGTEFGITGDYNAWTKLINDPVIAKDPGLQAAVRTFVGNILVDRNAEPGEIDHTAEPQVVMANVDALIAQADPLLREAAASDDAAAKTELRKKAAAFLDPAAVALNKLVEREKIAPEGRAEALNRLGAVYYKQGLRDKAARAWITLAQEHHELKVAEGAAVNAVTVAQDLYHNLPGAKRNALYVDLLRDALQALLGKFPHNDKAIYHTYTYASFLREQGDLADAVKAFAEVPTSHVFYADAMYELAVAHTELFKQAEEQARTAQALKAVEALLTADRELRKAMTGSGGDAKRADSLLAKLADAVLRRAEVFIGTERFADADGALANFERDFGKFPELVREARSNRVAILIGLNEVERAMEEVKRLAAESPETAGPLLYQVINKINERIDQLIILRRADEAAALAAKSVEIAEELLKWAGTQGDLKDKLLPFELTVARQLSRANKHAEAAALLDQIAKRPDADNNIDVILAQGEALASVARAQQMPEVEQTEAKALELLQRILLGVEDEKKYESQPWWRAWAMYLAVLDHRWERVKDGPDKQRAANISEGIDLAVGKLEQYDRYLGARQFTADPEIAKILNAMKIKHMAR